MANWLISETEADIQKMSSVLKISPALSKILANRGIKSKNQAIKYLKPNKNFLNNASTFYDIDKACDIIIEGVQAFKKFCIYGDYDVDGVVSCTIIYKTIKSLGATCDYYIPHREHEGYGLNLAAVQNISDNFDILITVDNGIASIEEINLAKSLGLSVIIIDHHEPHIEQLENKSHEVLPNACAIINPKQTKCTYPFKLLCAGAICYKVSAYIFQKLAKPFIYDDEFIILASIATFCDVVDLVDENRIIAACGLKLLNQEKNQNMGLDALIKARNLAYVDINAYAIGFIIGPCINATGRLKTATISLSLFLSDNTQTAENLAAELVALNEERKALCGQHVDKTIENLKQKQNAGNLDKIICIYKEDIHESIAGIIAGRIKDTLNRPTLVFTKSNELAKGSARSISAYNIFSEMQKHSHIFTKFGGHSMAAGASMKIENVETLRKLLNDSCTLCEADFVPTIYIDDELSLDDITFEFAQTLETLAPFGKANKKPIFTTRSIFTTTAEIIGQTGTTIRFTFYSQLNRKFTAICFKQIDKFMDMLQSSFSKNVSDNFYNRKLRNITIKMDIVYNIDINYYKGNATLNLNILDFKFKTD